MVNGTVNKKNLKLHQGVKICYICKIRLNKTIIKLETISNHTSKYRGAEHSICNLRDNVLNEIILIYHKGQTWLTLLS